MNLSDDIGKGPFFSLKWKVVAAVALLLTLSGLLVQLVIRDRVSSQFEATQSAHMQAQLRSWQALLDSGTDTLMQLATFIPRLEGGHDGNDLRDAIAAHATLLNLEWDIQQLAFHDMQGRLLAAWPAAPASAKARRWVRQAIATGEPVSEIDCSRECIQYLTVPVRDRDERRQGILLLGHSIAGAILSFARISGAEIAILGRPENEPDGRRTVLESWRRTVPGISNPERSLPLVRTLAARHRLEEVAAKPVLFEQNGHWYQAALREDPRHDFAYLLIDEVTDAVRDIDRTQSLILGITVTSFLVTAALLLLFLGQPLKRLRRLIAALPYIGEHQHEQVRRLMPRQRTPLTGRDEIDVLGQNMEALNEALENAEQARAQAEAHLVWLADHDPLTGLFNRRRFQKDFEQMLDQAVRHRQSGALLYFDLDDFKAINDISGHQAGDALLRLIASTLQEIMRSTDVLARLGGDEFGILVARCGRDEAVALAEKLLAAINALEFRFGNQRHHVSCSIGIALFPEHGGDIRLLLANADISMYQAKQSGQGRWHLFSSAEDYREVLSRRTLWRRKITDALREDRFVLHFQPVLDLERDALAWHEVLVRMRDGDELVPPDRFIPVAEQNGQIGEIDRWVTRHALRHLAEHPHRALSINLSGSVVADPDLPDWLEREFAEQGVAPERLIFEITETAAVENMDAAVELIQRMGDLGCRFALDDFGSGFASYLYLKRLPVDLIKIDGAFIRNMLEDEGDRLFVKALNEVAQGLGRLTVAEFVEDEATLAMLREVGIQYAQGFHIGRPAPFDDDTA